MTAKMEN